MIEFTMQIEHEKGKNILTQGMYKWSGNFLLPDYVFLTEE